MQEPIGQTWVPTFLENVYKETGGHPMLIQYVMQQVCIAPANEAEQSMEKAFAKFAREQRSQFNAWWSRYCTLLARRIYARLPDDGSALPKRVLTDEFGSDEANDALEILQHVGLVNAEEDDYAFRYSGEMFHRWYREYGILGDAPQHDPELYSRLREIGANLANKYLSAWKIYQSDIPNYSGALVEMRGVLEMLLDKYAPNNLVQVEPNFKLETDRQEPALRQRIRYMVRQSQNGERAKEIVSDYNLFEIQCERLSSVATMFHRTSSGMAHETATRDMAYKALKQWDGILAQLIPDA